MTKRNYNIDLMRIVATLLVIVLHVLGQGGILYNAPPHSIRYYIVWFFEIGAYCAVNCFALISGYVMADKQVKLKKAVGLWLEVLFYSVAITVLFFILRPETFSLKALALSFFPVLTKKWWYVSAYFGLLIFIPILNAFINTATQTSFRNILIAVSVIVGVGDCLLPEDAFLLNAGYSALWLMIMYLFGAYIKKYNLHKKLSSLKSLVGFFVMTLLTLLTKAINSESAFVSYTSITIVLTAVFLFIFCLNVKINNISAKIISILAPTTLGVYLIHVHPYVFEFCIKDAFKPFLQKPTYLIVIYILVATIAIFLVCAVIELIRIQLFKLLRINNLCEIIDKKINAR